MKVEIVLRSGKAFVGIITEQEYEQIIFREGPGRWVRLRECPASQHIETIMIAADEVAAVLIATGRETDA